MKNNQFTILLFIAFFILSCSENENRKQSLSIENSDVLTSKISAHRGGKNIDGYTENCLLTMQYLHEKYPTMMYEIDLQETRDKKIVLFHDDGLDRLTGNSGRIDMMDYRELRNMSLLDSDGNKTDCRIPLLQDVLQWADSTEVTLWLDFKPTVEYEKVIAFIERYNAEDNVVLIAYTIPQAEKLSYLTDEMMISAPVRNMEEWENLKIADVNLNNIIAFTGTRLSQDRLLKSIHKDNVPTMLGTLGNLDNKASANDDALYRKWLKQGYDLFSTDRPEASWKSIYRNDE